MYCVVETPNIVVSIVYFVLLVTSIYKYVFCIYAFTYFITGTIYHWVCKHYVRACACGSVCVCVLGVYVKLV